MPARLPDNGVRKELLLSKMSKLTQMSEGAVHSIL
jgi:hypothetical protein